MFEEEGSGGFEEEGDECEGGAEYVAGEDGGGGDSYCLGDADWEGGGGHFGRFCLGLGLALGLGLKFVLEMRCLQTSLDVG